MQLKLIWSKGVAGLDRCYATLQGGPDDAWMVNLGEFTFPSIEVAKAMRIYLLDLKADVVEVGWDKMIQDMLDEEREDFADNASGDDAPHPWWPTKEGGS